MRPHRALTCTALAAAFCGATACNDVTKPSAPSPSQPSFSVATSSTTPVISNVAVATNKSYVVVPNGLAVGAKAYIDRSYTAVSVPSVVAGATYIQTANNDKVADPGDTVFLGFDVDRDVTVFIAHDPRVPLPQWLKASFTSVGLRIVNTDYYGKKYLYLYKRSFPKGHVELGSNVDTKVNGNMYDVIIVPSDTSITSSSPDSTPPTVAITAPLDSAVVSGTVALSATATDNVGVVGVRFRVDSQDVAPEDTTSPYGVSWNSTLVSNGTHAITAVARDAAGNTALKVIHVTVQNLTTSSPTSSATHSGWYVSPTGSSSGSGSASSPWSLATALGGGNGKIQPGDTVWLRGGTYGSGEGTSTYSTTLAGTASAPIIFRQYPGERATINGTMSANGSYVWFWGFEIGNTVTSTQNLTGMDSHCTGCRFIDLVIHDHSGVGLSMWSEGPNQVAYGNIIYNNGFYGSTSTTYGHGIYAQNQTGTKLIRNNVLFDQFGYGVHVYGSGAAYLNNFTIDGNVSFNSGLGSGMDYHVGGGTVVNNLVFTNNMSYRAPGQRGNTMRLGYGWGPVNPSAVVTDNYLVGQILLVYWNSLTFQRNTDIDPEYQNLELEVASGQSMTTGTWNDNTYYRTAASSGDPFVLNNAGSGTSYTLSGWQQKTSFDGGSTLSPQLPTTTKVVVEPNAYEPGRANIVIYNWGNQGAVSVDLSNVLQVGDAYVVHNVYDFYGTPVASGTYGGGAVTLPITSAAPPRPIGGHSTLPTGSTFNVYVVTKQ